MRKTQKQKAKQNHRLEAKTRFIRELIKFFNDEYLYKRIESQKDYLLAVEWEKLRALTPLGDPNDVKAEEVLSNFLE